MRYIKKKNFLKEEVLLCSPEVHWFFVLKPLLAVLLVFLAFPLTSWIQYALAAIGDGITIDYHILKYPFLAVIILLAVYSIGRVLSYLNIEYGITNRRLIMKKGVLNLRVTEIPIERIESVHCDKGFFGRLFNYGTLCIGGIGGVVSCFHMVRKPFSVRRAIVAVIDRNRAVTVLQGPPLNPAPSNPVPPKKIDESSLYGTFVRVIPPVEV